MSGNPASKENGSSPPTGSAVLVGQIQAQLSDVLSAPLSSPAAAASSSDTPPASGSTTPGSQTVSDRATGAAGEPQAQGSTHQGPELAPAVGDPRAFLPPDGAHDAHDNHQPSAPPAGGAPEQARSQSQQPGGPEQIGTSALAPIPVLGAKLPVLTFSTSLPRGLPLADAAAPPQVQPSSSSSSSGADSQGASANHKEPTRPDTVPTVELLFPASAAHDTAAGVQSLAAGVTAKQDVAQVPSTTPTVAPGAPVAAPERVANAATAPHTNPPGATPAPLPPLQDVEVAANRFVNNAKLVEAAGHSEMRIAMDTDRLGVVELRAHMIGDTVGAAITVEKREAHAILAVELPALQQALSDKQLRIEQVTLLHGSLSSTMGDASTSTRHDEPSVPHGATRASSWDAGRISSMFGGSEPFGIFDSQGRLSVRA
jgi:hypothetical protein